jgi:predicted dehydrogenase
MKVLVVGCGSIGRRHAANAASLATVGVLDALPEAARECAQASGARAFERLEEALAWAPRAAIVATPHRSHLAIARRAVEAGADVLIEKPLSHSLEGVGDFLKTVNECGRRAYVVCNMRFHPGPIALKQALGRVGLPLFARAHVGNFLPSMRPGRDYRELYAARRSEGGGVVLDAVHEIDYLTWVLGEVESVACQAARLSQLDIDVEDHALLALRYASGVRASVELDYLRPRKSRGCEIVGTDGVLVWESDGKDPERCSVRFFRSGGEAWEPLIELPRVDTAKPYQDVIRAFLREIEAPGSTVLLPAGQAARVLGVALAALESSARGGAAQALANGSADA